jgi:hypothetical protein
MGIVNQTGSPYAKNKCEIAFNASRRKSGGYQKVCAEYSAANVASWPSLPDMSMSREEALKPAVRI